MDKQLKDGLPRPLSAKYESDFAYPTVKDRMPVILTKVVDTVYRMKSEILKTHGEEGVNDLKSIAGDLSRLKNELQTNKPVSVLEDKEDDVQLWNAYLEHDQKIQQQDKGHTSSWFQSSWLYIECYFYRRIRSAVALSKMLKTLDPFSEQKQAAYVESLPAMSTLASYLNENISKSSSGSGQSRDIFLQLFQVSLWGNKCDLSISGGAQNSQSVNPLTQLESLRPYILQDHSQEIWRHLSSLRSTHKKPRVDFVLDNAGFELFTDLCLADFLVAQKLVDVVHFHAKSMPWFVSDVTPADWNWTLEQISSSTDPGISALQKRLNDHVKNGSWNFKVHRFWTLPYEFQAMQSVAPDLYADLAQSNLIIIKGDLNYRKLAADLKWPVTTEFATVLRGFRPAPLCALRTLKCDLAVGLAPGQAEKAAAESKDWMLTGSYGVIQFAS